MNTDHRNELEEKYDIRTAARILGSAEQTEVVRAGQEAELKLCPFRKGTQILPNQLAVPVDPLFV